MATSILKDNEMVAENEGDGNSVEESLNLVAKTREELTNCMFSHIMNKRVGAVKSKFMCDFVSEDEMSITFMVTLWPSSDEETFQEHYITKLDKFDGKIVSTEPASIKRDEMEKIVNSANLGTLKEYSVYQTGSYAITYKITVSNSDDISTNSNSTYIVQMRYRGHVPSIHLLLRHIHSITDKDRLPVPKSFVPEFKSVCGLDVHISKFIPGVMGEHIYSTLSKDQKIHIVKQVARAFSTVWDLDISHEKRDDYKIGEFRISESNDKGCVAAIENTIVSADGPFNSVTEYLQCWIKQRVEELESQQGIDEFKLKYLSKIKQFVKNELQNIPSEVENVPITLVNSDMGLHNLIFRKQMQDDQVQQAKEEEHKNPVYELKAVIDWEHIYYLPFLVNVVKNIEPLFQSDPVLREAFWNEIPEWKDKMTAKSSQIFIDYYSFGFFLKAWQPLNPKINAASKWKSWEKNSKTIDDFLSRHGSSNRWFTNLFKIFD